MDEIFADPGYGVAGVSSCDTNDPLYLGGLPPNAKRTGIEPGVGQFVGCIRNVHISAVPIPLKKLAQVVGNVTASTCPTV